MKRIMLSAPNEGAFIVELSRNEITVYDWDEPLWMRSYDERKEAERAFHEQLGILVADGYTNITRLRNEEDEEATDNSILDWFSE